MPKLYHEASSSLNVLCILFNFSRLNSVFVIFQDEENDCSDQNVAKNIKSKVKKRRQNDVETSQSSDYSETENAADSSIAAKMEEEDDLKFCLFVVSGHNKVTLAFNNKSTILVGKPQNKVVFVSKSGEWREWVYNKPNF